MASVAVVGTGSMGGRIAGRLCMLGHQVIVWNRSVEKLEPLLERGAEAAETPREAAARSETVITMVADPAALRAVSEGPDGIAAGSHPELTIIEMSTIGAAAIRRLASILPPGVALVDAPVVGSIAEAEAGTLTFLAGGDLDNVETLLHDLGTVVRTGPVGSGAGAKLIANASFFGTLAVLGEVLAFADALGFKRETSRAVLAATPLAEQAERRWPSVESGAYPRRFALSRACKDAELIREEGRRAGAAMPTLDTACEWLAAAALAGRGDDDYTAVLATIAGAAEESPTRPAGG